MQKQILIVTTTSDFLYKFELDNVKILQSMGYTVHYAANMNEPHYLSSEGVFGRLDVTPHHIPIARSPYLFHDNKKALYCLIDLIREIDGKTGACDPLYRAWVPLLQGSSDV